MTDPTGDFNLTLGADVSAFVAAMRAAREQAEKELAQLDTSKVEQRMDQLYRVMANQAVAYAKQAEISLDGVMAKIRTYNVLMEDQANKFETYLHRAAAVAGTLTREESIGRLRSKVGAFAEEAVSEATQGYKTEFADMPLAQLEQINANMLARTQAAAQQFADIWNVSVSEVMTAVRAEFSILDSGISSMLAKRPGTVLTGDLEKVIPVTKQVAAEIAKIESLITDLTAAQRMSPMAGMRVYGERVKEAAALAKMDIRGATSTDIFGGETGTESKITVVDKLLSKLNATKNAYMDVARAQKMAMEQVQTMTVPQIIDTKSLLLVDAGMKNVSSSIADTIAQVNTLQQELAQAPSSQGVEGYTKRIRDLQDRIVELTKQLDVLKVASRQIATGMTPMSVMGQAMQEVEIHPSSLFNTPAQLAGRALQQSLINAGVSDVDAYAAAFKSVPTDAVEDAGARHGTAMHELVQRELAKSNKAATWEFEKSLKSVPWEGFRITGRVDWVDKARNILTDFKAIGKGEWAQLETAVKSHNFASLPLHLKKYVAQLETYGRAMQELTGKEQTLQLMRLPSRRKAAEYGSLESAAVGVTQDILAGKQPTITWKAGVMLDNDKLKAVMDEYKVALQTQMADPENQLKVDTAIQTQRLLKEEQNKRREVQKVAEETVAADQRDAEALARQVKETESRARAAGGGAGVPPTPPAPPFAEVPPEEPDYIRTRRQAWDEMAKGLTLEQQYVKSKVEEAQLEELIGARARERATTQGEIVQAQARFNATNLQQMGETNSAYESRLANEKEVIKSLEERKRINNEEVEYFKTRQQTQARISQELKAQLDLAAQQARADARAITDPRVVKMAEAGKRLQATSPEDLKARKAATLELEKQIKAVEAQIVQRNVESNRLSAIAQQSAAALSLEKARLAVLEKEAALLQQQAEAQAKRLGATPEATRAGSQAAEAQAAVTAQQGVVAQTEVLARANRMAASEAEASTSAMRQQVAAAAAIEKAFGDAGKKTHEWVNKVFSLRHVVSSFFGMTLSMIGYGIFGKIQEVFGQLQEQVLRVQDSVYALRGAVKSTQDTIAEGVSFEIKPGTTVEQFVGTSQEWVNYLDDLRVKFQNIWSTATMQETFANVENLTTELGLTKEQMMQLMEASAVFAMIDRDMVKANNDIGKSSEQLARVLQGNIRNLAVTAVKAITPQQQADAARALGLQAQWDKLQQLSGPESAHLTALVNLEIVSKRLLPRMDEVNDRLNTMSARYRENAGRAQDLAQASRAGLGIAQARLQLETTWQDIWTPVKDPKIIIGRFVADINTEFEMQLREGKWGELTDKQLDAVKFVFETRAREAVEPAVHWDPVFQGYVNNLMNSGKVIDTILKDVNREWHNGEIAILEASEAVDTYVEKVARLPEIDFPGMADQLNELEEKRVERRSESLEDLFRDFREAEKKYADSLEDDLRGHTERLVQIDQSFVDKLNDIHQNRLESIADAQQQLADKLEDIERERREALDGEDNEDKLNKALQEAAIDHARKIEDINIDHFRRLKEIRDQFIFDLEGAAQERNARQALQLVRQYNFNVEKEREEHGQRLEDADRDYARKIEDIYRRQAEERERQQKDFEKKIEDAKRDFARRLEEIEKDTQRAIRDAQKDRADEVKKEGVEYERKRRDRLEAFQQDLSDTRQHHQDRLDEIEDDVDDQLRVIARGWQKKYKLDQDQLALAYSQFESYYGPGGYFQRVMDWWSQYVARSVTAVGSISQQVPFNPLSSLQPPKAYQNPVMPTQPVRPPRSGPQELASGSGSVSTNRDVWSGTHILEVRVTADEHFSQDFEDKVIEVMTEAFNGIRT